MGRYKKRYILVVALFATLFISTLPVWAEGARHVYTRYSSTHEVDLAFGPKDRIERPDESPQSYTRYSGTHEVDLAFGSNDIVDSEGAVERPLSLTTDDIYAEGPVRRNLAFTTRPYVVQGTVGRPLSLTTDDIYAEGHARRNLAFTIRPYILHGNSESAVDERPQDNRVQEDGGTTAWVEEDDDDRRGDGATTPYSEAENEGQETPEVQPVPPNGHSSGKVRIKSVKLLQVRETSRGGSLPFDVKDVEQEISPKGIRDNQTSSTKPVTCGNQRFPVGAGMTNDPIQFRFPDAGGACEIGLTVSSSAEIAFTITSISASSANVTGLNGWSTNLSNISYGIGSTVANSITLSRNGVSYTIGIDAEGTGAGAFPIYINVTSFSGPS